MAYVIGSMISLTLAFWFLLRGDGLFVTLGLEAYRTAVLRLIPLAVCACIILCSLSFAFASLEGKSSWILKSAPIGNELLSSAKRKVILCVTAPLALVTAVIFSVAFRLDFGMTLYYLLLPLSVSLLAAFGAGKRMKR